MELEPTASALPAQPFFSTPQQRLALARQRYFEEGVRPSGLVGESVIQSWSRCVQSRRNPAERIAFNPVTPSRIHSALGHSRPLLEAAAADLEQLEQTLAGTACTAILTDAHGVVVHATRSGVDHGAVLLPLARRIGVNLDEQHIGTGAPGVVLRSGQATLVLGPEHFFGHMQVLHCAAAPIRDASGALVAVLDLTTEGQPFGFDAAAICALYATTIENQWLKAQSTEHVVVHLATTPSLFGTPMEGLAALDASGHIAWINPVAARLLGMAPGQTGHSTEPVFGIDAKRLVLLTHTGQAVLHRLPNGLNLWLAARMQARDGAGPLVRAAVPAPPAVRVAAPQVEHPPATLRDNDKHLIERTVRACDGNISKAARLLGISRGRVYRHLQQTRPPDIAAGAD
jgi:sigma-54 dependent transcriptional regulator, acetoin dehydrogenase operon transcriptional activator AcoR